MSLYLFIIFLYSGAKPKIENGRLVIKGAYWICFPKWAEDEFLIDGASCWIIKFKKCVFDFKTQLLRPSLSACSQFSVGRSLSSPTYESGIGLDFTFDVDGHQIRASRYVLCENSPIFIAMFANEWKDSRENLIELEDVSHLGMATFIKILHGVNVSDVTPSVAIEMIAIAEKYQVPEIKTQSADYAKQRLSNENVIDALVVAHRLDVKDMEEVALDYVTSNKFGTDLNELNGFVDIPLDISKLINQAYRKKFVKQ